MKVSASRRLPEPGIRTLANGEPADAEGRTGIGITSGIFVHGVSVDHTPDLSLDTDYSQPLSMPVNTSAVDQVDNMKMLLEQLLLQTSELKHCLTCRTGSRETLASTPSFQPPQAMSVMKSTIHEHACQSVFVSATGSLISGLYPQHSEYTSVPSGLGSGPLASLSAASNSQASSAAAWSRTTDTSETSGNSKSNVKFPQTGGTDHLRGFGGSPSPRAESNPESGRVDPDTSSFGDRESASPGSSTSIDKKDMFAKKLKNSVKMIATKNTQKKAGVNFKMFQSAMDSDMNTKSDAMTVHDRGRDSVKLEQNQKSGPRARTTRIVASNEFEVLAASCLTLNIVSIGVSIEHQASQLSEDTPDVFVIFGYFFCIAFVVEAIMRYIAAGPAEYFCGRDRIFNWIDVFGAALAIFESLGQLFLIDAFENLGVMRIARVVRLLRVVRLVRIFRFVEALKMLINSIISTLKSLFWAMVLLCALIYGAALVFTQASTQTRQAGGSGTPFTHLAATDLDGLAIYWGSVGASMCTLFMAISNGFSWEIAFRSLNSIHEAWGALFIAFISFTYFAVLNVITAHFCQAAMESAAADQDALMRSINGKRKAFNGMVMSVFEQIDANSSGHISLKELEDRFQDDMFRDFLASLDVEPVDAWSLFKLIDTTGEQLISCEDFIRGCVRLRGAAKQLALSELHTQQSWLTGELTKFMNFVGDELHAIKEAILVC